MREIKFRAWDSDVEKMLFEEEFPIFYEKDNGFHSGKSADNGDWAALPLMQYTGLKDENGVDIYEGDICESEYVVPEEHLTLNLKVEFITGCYCVKDKFGSTNPLYEDNEFIKVVGNIYENPDLL